MGTDSKYLEEAMTQLENSLETFGNNTEITSLIVNNLENRLDNVVKSEEYADIQGGIAGVLHTLAENDICLSKKQYEFLISRIVSFEKDTREDKFLYDSIMDYYYIRYYEHFTFRFGCKSCSCEWKRTQNYVHDLSELHNHLEKETKSNGNYIADSLRENKIRIKDIEEKRKVYKYVVTYTSKPFYCEETGHYITLETGCYKWVEE